MKAIIIEEHRFTDLREAMRHAANSTMKDDATVEQKDINAATWRVINHAFVKRAQHEGMQFK